MTANPQAAQAALTEALRLEKEGQAEAAALQYQKMIDLGVRTLGLHRKLLTLRGFDMAAPPEHNARLFERVLLPAMEAALKREDFDAALELEGLAYTCYIKQTETEEHYDACFRRIIPLMERAGEHIRRLLPPLPLPPESAPLRVGFFFHNAWVLAHTEVLLSYLEGLHRLEEKPLEPHIYVYRSPGDKRSPEFEARFAAVGAQVHYLADYIGENKSTEFKRFIALRRLVELHGVSVLTWVSLPLYLAFASSMGVAPLHAWYALRFHPKGFTHVDAYIGGGSFFNERKTLFGQEWRAVFVAYKDMHDPALLPQAEAIRGRWPGKTILGSIARPEKIMGAEYLSMVQCLLNDNPDTVFLWTSHNNGIPFAPLVREFERLGIASRCHCVGWVDPKLYSLVFDVYLDSFPSVSGMTAVNGMAAGTPLVSMHHDSMMGDYAYPFIHGEQGTPEQQQHMRDIFIDAQTGESYLMCARSLEEYREMAQKLISDAGFRKRAGLAQQRFALHYFCNQKGLALRMNKHLLEIVAEARMKQAAA